MAVSNKKAPKAESKKKPDEPSEGAWKLGADGSKTRSGRLLPFETKLRELLAGAAGTMRLVAGDDFAANAILAKTDELAYGYAKLAKEKPEVKRVLEFVFSSSAIAEAALPTASLVLMLAWHYGFFVPDKIGGMLAYANGVIPESREVEVERKREEMQAQGEKEARADGGGTD